MPVTEGIKSLNYINLKTEIKQVSYDVCIQSCLNNQKFLIA